MPNAWDAGSARLLESLGFLSLATTSSGFAATLGRLDGSVTRDEALAHAAQMVAAVDVPVSADLENGYADEPDAVAETASLAVKTGLAGFSIEDYTRRTDEIYGMGLAVDRVRAAAEAAHSSSPSTVLTARAENHIRGIDDLDDTISRLQAFQAVGADVLFAPGRFSLEEVRRIVDSVDRPLSVLARPGGPTVPELAGVGVRRISVGGAFAYAALGAVVEAGRELLDEGTFGYGARAKVGGEAARAAFRD